MPRADRLLQLIQIFRRHRRPVTAEKIADELGVSVRTVYRDISGLVADGVPVDGEAGVGYVLNPGFDLPPLMLTVDEVEALLVGLRWVRSRGDPALIRAALDVESKIGAVLPVELRPVLFDATLEVPRFSSGPVVDRIDVGALRAAIRTRHKMQISYRDAPGALTERVIWPIAMGYLEMVRVVVSWCELRRDFRSFRTDRIIEAAALPETYKGSRERLLAQWRKQNACERN